MKILITGNRGFVGAATQRMLEARGHEVIGFDIADGCSVLTMEIMRVVKAHQPDRILHLAAVARFADADKDPVTAFEVNTQGTKNVAECAQMHGIPLVHASTGSVYMPLRGEMPIPETYPVAGNSIYGCSKVVAEKYVQRLTSPWMILRYGHLYGAEKVGHGLIGGYLDAISNGRNPKLFGGDQTNDFMAIQDVVWANVCALEAPLEPGFTSRAWGEIFNIGTGVELSARAAGDIVCQVFGYAGPVDIVAQRSVDPDRFVLDCTKAERLLGFKAELSFHDGLMAMKRILEQRQAA